MDKLQDDALEKQSEALDGLERAIDSLKEEIERSIRRGRAMKYKIWLAGIVVGFGLGVWVSVCVKGGF